MPPTTTQAENADLLDREMNRILREGVKALDKDGNVVSLTPTAAMLNAIRGRIKDLGINALPVQGSPAGDLIQSAIHKGMKFRGRVIPPVDTESADAATGTE